MFRHIFVTIFVFIVCFIATILCQNLSLIDELPKCCDLRSFVVEENSTLLCKNSTSRRLYVNNKFVDLPDDQKVCIDVFKSDFFIFGSQNDELIFKSNISSKALRKCCPFGYLYNYQNKSCEESDIQSALQANLIKVGLPECKIIRDYLFGSPNAIIEQVDKNYSNTCLDQTTSGEYVLRVCESINTCKTTRCLHKCCEDGKSFVNGSHCKDTFEKGLFLQHLSKNIENLTGKET